MLVWLFATSSLVQAPGVPGTPFLVETTVP